AAVEASAAAGFDAGWYAAAGTLWLVRRSTLDVRRPVRAGERLLVNTWVEDFRRVRSHRRYELVGTDGLCVDARTDWVYVDAENLRPRRVPGKLEQAFGLGKPLERETWQAPTAPLAPACTSHRVQLHELDSLRHVNNAAYLDIAAQALFDVLEEAGWTFDPLMADGVLPVFTRGDLEYLDAARYGERLEVQTWFSMAMPDLVARQHVCRDGRRAAGARKRAGELDDPRGRRGVRSAGRTGAGPRPPPGWVRSMPLREGMVAVVTGASAGIGAAVARELAAAGVRVVLGARRRTRLGGGVASIRGKGGGADSVEARMRVEAQGGGRLTAA